MAFNLFTLGNSIQKFYRTILGMRGHKAYSEISVDCIDFTKKSCEINVVFESLTVRVNVLSEKHYLLEACVYHFASLGYNLFFSSGNLSSSDVWHDTVGTEIVAAVHYRKPTLKILVAVNRDSLDDIVVFIRNLKNSSCSRQPLIDKLGKPVNNVGSEKHIDVRITHLDTVGYYLLLCHTTANSDYCVFLFSFMLLCRSDISKNSIFGMRSDSTGVKKNEISVFGFFAKLVSHILKHSFNMLAIGNVLLTTVSINACFGSFSVYFRKQFFNPGGISD